MRIVLDIRISDKVAHDAPQWVFVWADPYWNGMWAPATLCVGADATFSVALDLHPLAPAALEQWAHAKYERLRDMQRTGLEMGTQPQPPTLCDALKMHFHSQRNETLEMRYASCVPLRSLSAGRRNCLGAWTTAQPECDHTGEYLDGVSVEIMAKLVEPEVGLLASCLIQAVLPDKAHHVKMKRIGNWIADVLSTTYGSGCTGFVNVRTVLQDRCMTTFFSDIPSIVEPSMGTTLPPTLAVYSVCNALRVHRMSAAEFLRNLQEPALVLRLVRDMLTPWTMCRVEGRYAADVWCGKACEDQPFTNSLKPGTRVFTIDDCEGRNQEACIHAVLMFLWFYLDVTENASAGVNAHFGMYPPSLGCLAFGGVHDAAFKQLTEVCCKVGELFHRGVLQAHMSVGDVYFHSKLESHSFGLLVYSDNVRRLYDGIVMETTAWDMTVEQETTLTFTKGGLMDTMLQTIHVATSSHDDQSQDAYVRNPSSRAHRLSVYRGIFTGADCLFFGKRGLTYGITLDDLKAELPLLTSLAEIQACETAFRISMEHFIAIAATGNGCWTLPKSSDANEAMLTDYRDYLTKKPAFARSLRPPPQPEEEYMRRMRSWGALGSADVTPSEQRAPPSHAVTAFVWRTDAIRSIPKGLGAQLAAAIRSGAIVRSCCMHSTVYTCASPL